MLPHAWIAWGLDVAELITTIPVVIKWPHSVGADFERKIVAVVPSNTLYPRGVVELDNELVYAVFGANGGALYVYDFNGTLLFIHREAGSYLVVLDYAGNVLARKNLYSYLDTPYVVEVGEHGIYVLASKGTSTTLLLIDK